MKGVRIVCYNVLYLFSDGKNMLASVTHAIDLYTYKELLLLHRNTVYIIVARKHPTQCIMNFQ